jgi:uncharacterized protein (DUF111 family)
MSLLYIDPVFGISGDMTVSALLDAGCPFAPLEELLKQLPITLPPLVPEKNVSENRGKRRASFGPADGGDDTGPEG